MSPFQVFSAALLLAMGAHAIQLKETDSAWGPSDSVQALDGVIAAVEKIANNTHLSPEKLAKARHVAEDVKLDIESVEKGNLTKQQAHEKVGAAIKELTAFESDLQKMPADRLATLKKQLADKEAELKKAQNMMKLLNLKKQLIENKLMLQKLLSQKAAAGDDRKADEAEAAKNSAMVKNVLNMTKGLEGASATVKSARLQAVGAAVQTRVREVTEALAKADAEQKKAEASLDAAIAKQLPTKGKADAISKGQSMLKLIKTQEHRKFAKARALKEIELKELKEVQAKVEKKDIAGLEKVLAKLQQEGQALQAKSGNFLH
jgi:hypothetical protein